MSLIFPNFCGYFHNIFSEILLVLDLLSIRGGVCSLSMVKNSMWAYGESGCLLTRNQIQFCVGGQGILMESVD